VTNPLKKLIEFEFFQRVRELEKPGQIIWWWEKRRFWFNMVIGLIGLVNCLLMVGIALYADFEFGRPMEIPDPTGSDVLIVLVYGIMANICYTGGWVAELTARNIWRERARYFGQMTFALGIVFSATLTLVPAAICLLAVILKVIKSAS
jgi:hypothetical protein